MIVTNRGAGGKLPSVEDRGDSLNGSSYQALGTSDDAQYRMLLLQGPAI